MENMLNYQILIETMVKCGGNCSGCALSSSERMSKADIDLLSFKKIAKQVHDDLDKKSKDGFIFESISIFLGQGDHFLMPDHQLEEFMEICSLLVPDRLKSKSLIFISASAIGKHNEIKKKMDRFYDLSLLHKVPFFIQVVFDPKKIDLSKKFTNTYLENILYFKNKCGMTELTINLGSDLYSHMKPIEFHNWVKKNKIAHIELNWVINSQTIKMWNLSHIQMIDWLIDLLTINKDDRSYEINFIPFLLRSFKFKNAERDIINKELKEQLTSNIYYDINGNKSYSQVGLVSNLIPVKERLSVINIEKPEEVAIKVQSVIEKNRSCSQCEYKNVCSIIGSSIWIKSTDSIGCPYGIYKLIKFVDVNLSNDTNYNTIFDKNPVQDKILLSEGNDTYNYFVNKIYKKLDETNE